MASLKAQLRTEIDKELHDLCGPITILACRLELGQMRGDAESMKEAVDGAMVACQRTFAGIASMRRRLNEICSESGEA